MSFIAFDIELMFNAADLQGGNYLGYLNITSNDPVFPETIVPVSLLVMGTADISVTPEGLYFAEVFIGDSLTMGIVVENSGTDILEIIDITLNG